MHFLSPQVTRYRKKGRTHFVQVFEKTDAASGRSDWEAGLMSTLVNKEDQIPLCLSRLCFSGAGESLILARVCSRWFIKIGPGITRGPEEKHFAHA